MSALGRREFIRLVGGAAAAWPLAARAQHTIGVLILDSPNPEPLLEALREGLRDAGYVEGRKERKKYPVLGTKPTSRDVCLFVRFAVKQTPGERSFDCFSKPTVYLIQQQKVAHDARRSASRSPNYDRDVGCGAVAAGGLATAAF
jgi:hypothetical protein